MPSPFYTPGPDIFGGGLQARRDAQADFSDRLGQLYAGGNQQAGQVLGGIAPDKLDAIRSALEKMPATEQAKAKQRVDMLKKWIYSISQTQDEPTRALMWNQMIAQAHQSGADVSNISPNYSEAALREAQTGLMTIDEMMNSQKESRLTASAGGAGTQSERDREFLRTNDSTSEDWQKIYLDQYLRPRQFTDPNTGNITYSYDIPTPAVYQKALAVGLPISKTATEAYKGIPPSGAEKPAGGVKTVGEEAAPAPKSVVVGAPLGATVPGGKAAVVDKEDAVKDANWRRDKAFEMNQKWNAKKSAWDDYLAQINQARSLIASPTTVADLGTINTFQKLIDPGAVVRDADVTLIQDTGGIVGQLKAKLNSAEGTGKLSAQTRTEMLGALDVLAKNVRQRESVERARLEGSAQGFGIDTAAVFGGSAPTKALPAQRSTNRGAASLRPK